MTVGKFILARETEYTTLNWGRVGAHCSPSRTGAKQLTVVEAQFYPGKGHDFHKHPSQEEVIMVISGKIEQWLETENRILGPGDSVFIPPDTVHASFNIGYIEAKIIAMFGPSIGESGLETMEMATEKPWNALRMKVEATKDASKVGPPSRF